jgi:MarR family transcriptional regulator, transcriptional regulator for hemolysin
VPGFGPLLAEVSRLWRLRLDERLRPLGLSQAKWVALYRLARLPTAPTQAELAMQLGVEGPTVARLVDRLEAADYVSRRPSPLDGRVKVIHLTAKARAEAARIDRVAQGLRTELLAELDPDALEAATRVLLALRAELAPGTPAPPRPPSVAGRRPRQRDPQ